MFWLIVVPLLWLIAPMYIGQGPKPAPYLATSNTKQLGLALLEFENKYKSYPNDATVSQVTSDFPTHGYKLTGESSNATFRQLIAAGLCTSENIFYSEMNVRNGPDGHMNPGEALQKGEVGFAYISGLTSESNPSTPLVLTPLIPGTTQFDPKPFKGKAIVLHIDQTVSIHDIADDGHIYDKGIDILSPNHPFWNGKTPTIHYPE